MAIDQALENSFPAIISAVCENTASMSNFLPDIANVNSGHAMDVTSSTEALSGTLRLPAVVLTFPSVLAITRSSRPVATFTSPVMATHVTTAFSGLDSPVFSPSFDKAFIVGSGHAPIPAKLVSKMICGQFMAVLDLFPANLHSVKNEPQTFLEGMLLVLNKCRVLEMKDILRDQGFHNLSNGDVLSPPSSMIRLDKI